MGFSKDGKYQNTNPNIERVYLTMEAPDGNGWMIGWRTVYGQKLNPLKRVGVFETIEDAQAALDDYAVDHKLTYSLVDEDPKTGKRTFTDCVATALDEHQVRFRYGI